MSASTLDTYGKTYRDLMNDFNRQMQTLTSQPLPTAATKKERQKHLAASLDKISGTDAAFAQRLDHLAPPPLARPIHDATYHMFLTAEQGNKNCAAAVRRGDRAEIDRVFRASEKAEGDAMKAMAQAARDTAKDPNLSDQEAKALNGAAQRLTHP